MVAAEQIPAQFGDKGLRRNEHLRFRPAKTVNALLGITDDEDAWRLPTSSGIAAQPRMQRLPLQRIGVLKFIDQQMLDARIEPLLNPTR